MTKGERLIWELFEMVRELMPVTEANTKRFTEWSAKFHEMEVGVSGDDAHQAVDTADHDADEDEPGEDPHEHGAPPRRKRRG
ncbi:MAG TPA: hypothetical protein VKB76_20530 [Ktedonobacterales bacterium]|nr:hypothetical protein [Ktedonobacterales bacterium]